MCILLPANIQDRVDAHISPRGIFVNSEMLLKKLALLESNEFELAFAYELATFPPALFSPEGQMRQPTGTTDLGNYLLSKYGSPDQRSDIPECTMVVDGDAAIAETQVSWKKGATFL